MPTCVQHKFSRAWRPQCNYNHHSRAARCFLHANMRWWIQQKNGIAMALDYSATVEILCNEPVTLTTSSVATNMASICNITKMGQSGVIMVHMKCQVANTTSRCPRQRNFSCKRTNHAHRILISDIGYPQTKLGLLSSAFTLNNTTVKSSLVR